MKKNRSYGWLVFWSVPLAIMAFFSWMIWYPQVMTYLAHHSVEIGQPLNELVKKGSPFLRGRGKIDFVMFSVPREESEKTTCAILQFRDDKAQFYTGSLLPDDLKWEGPYEQLNLVDFKEDLSRCSVLAAIYMPASFYMGTNAIEYNEDLVVTGKRDPVFWD